jgi:hypothetical protein
MSEILVGLISGFIFGLGLCLSGLTDPSVVQGFLDVAGAWNPALLLVMGAGLTVTLIGYRLVFGRGRPLWSPRFNLPTSVVSCLCPVERLAAVVAALLWKSRRRTPLRRGAAFYERSRGRFSAPAPRR